MRILAIGLVIVVTMLLLGCVGYSEPLTNLPTPAQSEYSEHTNVSPIPVQSGNPTSIVLPNEPPTDRTWISPGKVNVGNFYPGARAEYSLTIHNGNDTVSSFSVAYRYPDNVAEGYVKPLPEVQSWVIIADATPILMPKETKDVLVVLAMPKEAVSPTLKWEFWVSVMDTTQKGMIRTELCCRWLVQMRK